jgi:uncharacterized MAPEG superfamily protein
MKVTIAFWCVLAAALMPYVWAVAAKGSMPNFDNNAPRPFLESLDGWGQRANWAQMNAFEAFPAFAAAVLIGSVVGNIEQAMLNMLAVLFIVCRVLHGVFYITDKAVLRSIVWFAGISSWVAILILSV